MIDAKQMIAEINRAVADDEADLTEWEAKFVESIGGQLQAERPLSERQDEILEGIWRKVRA